MKKVLIITYYWPPSGGSGVQRWTKFAKYLPSEGWQPVIYTPENPDVPSIDHSLEADVEGVTVIKHRITEFYSLWRKITGQKAGNKEVNPLNAGEKTLKQKAMLAIRGNLFIPDPRVTWVGPSVKFLKKYLRDHPVDVIVTTGPPHSMHLIGMNVSAATGIPWIADFRDPWTKLFYFKHMALSKWADSKHRRLEKQVLDRSDAVIAVSPFVQKEFEEMTETPVHLITNGYDACDFARQPDPDGFFNVTHTGLFAADGNPLALWEALADKCVDTPGFKLKLRIRLAGKTDGEIIEAIKAAGLEDNLQDLGYQEHTEAVKEQINASLLILPLRREPEYRATLPGKLFEYLAALNPILGIGQTDGAMAGIVNETEAGTVCGWEDKAGIRNFIDRIWESFLSGSARNDTKNIEKYSRTATTRQLAKLLNHYEQDS